MGVDMGIEWGLTGALLFSLLTAGRTVTAESKKRDPYLAWQKKQSVTYLLKNISPPGAASGAVVAATSKHDPDYFFHWVRDAGIVMSAVVDLYAAEQDPVQKEKLFWHLLHFTDFSRQNQLTPNPSGGLGEPKFMPDGAAFIGPWGRPQNDGPALRAIALTKLAHLWLKEGKDALVKGKLYDGILPSKTVIKDDLEFIARHWPDTCYDLWEEISGHHFYTRIVQRKALIDGAALALQLGDDGASAWYLKQAKLLEAEILRHWDSNRRILVPTLNRDGGIKHKISGLDSSVILAVLHGETPDGFLGFTDDRVLATFVALKEAFLKLYPINQDTNAPGIAIGRYPEDQYTGHIINGEGNPWFLITLGFAEFLYRAADAFERAGGIKVTETNRAFFKWVSPKAGDFEQIIHDMRALGHAFMARARYHVNEQGRYSEQFNRYNGFMQGAADLTWSYAAYLTALAARRG